MLKYVIRYVLEKAPKEMEFFNSFIDKGLLDRLNHVLNSEFGHVTYTEAIEILEKHNDKFDYKVSGKLCSAAFGRGGQAPSTGALLGQFARMLFLLLPLCGAAVGMLYLAGQAKLI